MMGNLAASRPVIVSGISDAFWERKEERKRERKKEGERGRSVAHIYTKYHLVSIYSTVG